jgi:hypothetical protein
MISPGGKGWAESHAFPHSDARVSTGLAPGTGSGPWILAGSTTDGRGAPAAPTIWTSSDLASWSTITLPTSPAPAELCRAESKPEPCSAITNVDELFTVPGGYVAVGSYLYDGIDVGGFRGSQTWFSPDGLTWTDLGPSPFGAVNVAAGPAGVIGIGVPDRGNAVGSWLMGTAAAPAGT